ncbi:toxin YdaT family protein [Cronobacter muytjensii]|uniref:toxin YdaT family protein n=1 Tax=Cronobacter muytjensii TaxID=413501 RepID=UPI002DB998EB|nr:toxin YdaT family protein [Cronobacter muytjensii]MEB8638625.1 toxin YdaT family protein [Cronobacter muytjensii]
MKIEHVLPALLALRAETNGEDVARRVAAEWFAMGGEGLLQRPDEPRADFNNKQRLFRWAECETPRQREKIRQLLPAIERALPAFLRAQFGYRDSAAFRELVDAKRAFDNATEALLNVLFACREQATSGGPAGGSELRH